VSIPKGKIMSQEFYTRLAPVFTASDGSAAVSVTTHFGKPELLTYAPSSVGEWKNREHFAALFARAMNKAGFKRDRRCKGGWRKVSK
jgi:hypothetical protein